MTQKKCVKCSKRFKPVNRHPYQRYCSEKCRRETYNKAPLKPIKCKQCAKLIQPRTIKIKFCSTDCGKKYRYITFSKRNIKNKCIFCKKEFTPSKNSNQKYCSIRCRYDARNVLRKKPPFKPRKCKFCNKNFIPRFCPTAKCCSKLCKDRYDYDTKRRFKPYKTECKECNKTFMVTNGKASGQKYCSDICRLIGYNSSSEGKLARKKANENFVNKLKTDAETKRRVKESRIKYRSSAKGLQTAKKRIKLYKKNGKMQDWNAKYRKTDKCKISQRKFYLSEKGKLCGLRAARKRRAHFYKVNECFTQKEWEEKLQKTKGKCMSCKRKVGFKNLTLDHIMPVSKAPKGFTYTIEDIQPLCLSCNAKKSNKIYERIC